MRSCLTLFADAQTYILYILTNTCIANLRSICVKFALRVAPLVFLTSVPVEPSRQDDLSALPSPTEALIIHPGPGDVQGGHEVLLGYAHFLKALCGKSSSFHDGCHLARHRQCASVSNDVRRAVQ